MDWKALKHITAHVEMEWGTLSKIAKAITASREAIQELLHTGVQKAIHNESLPSLHSSLPILLTSTFYRPLCAPGSTLSDNYGN